MPRQPRMFLPGLPAHIVHRGNDRCEIFRCQADYLFLRDCLVKAMARYGVAIHSYVFMTNHFHLVATPSEDGALSAFVQSAARRYVGYFNSRYERTGTLWEGRFHGAVIKDDRYVFACHRYIDMNPVRAALAARPEDYPWSSHRFYSFGEPDSMVVPHPLIVGMGREDATRRAAYRGLFEMELTAEELKTIRCAAQTSKPLGGLLVTPKHIGRPRKTRL